MQAAVALAVVLAAALVAAHARLFRIANNGFVARR